MGLTQMETLEKAHSYPLAKYEGAKPTAPKWFQDAISTEYTRHELDVDGAKVTYQQWGDVEKPGLFLVHGGGAHAHWFDFIAPAFIDDFNIVAMNFSGMGDSDWRARYSFEQFSAEQSAVLDHAGFLDHTVKPIIAAHSFGGLITLTTAAKIGHLFKDIVLLDSAIFPSDYEHRQKTPRPSGGNKHFPDLTTALSRFRLLPPQPCQNHFILDHIARHSLKQVDKNGVPGWSWKFDPTLWEKLDDLHLDQWDVLSRLPCKLAFLRGEHSSAVTDEVRDLMLSQVNVPFCSIKDANHHVFLDKPLETILELKRLIAL